METYTANDLIILGMDNRLFVGHPVGGSCGENLLLEDAYEIGHRSPSDPVLYKDYLCARLMKQTLDLNISQGANYTTRQLSGHEKIAYTTAVAGLQEAEKLAENYNIVQTFRNL